MSKDACGKSVGDSELLIATVFANVFDDKPREMKCLVDGGSTHSFISPMSVADKYLKLINKCDSSLKFKEFEIQGATGTVISKCCVVSCRIELGKWSGEQEFIISNKVAKFDMVWVEIF